MTRDLRLKMRVPHLSSLFLFILNYIVDPTTMGQLYNPLYTYNYISQSHSQPVLNYGQSFSHPYSPYSYVKGHESESAQETRAAGLYSDFRDNSVRQNSVTWIVPNEEEEEEAEERVTYSDPTNQLYKLVESMMRGQSSKNPIGQIMHLSERITDEAERAAESNNGNGFTSGNVFTTGGRRKENKHRHPCLRPCSTDPSTRMTCGYNFTVANYLTLSPHCFNCPNVTRDCGTPGCLPANGIQMPVAVVNKLMPGPPIRVCEGDTVVVDVHNKLSGQETTIHWHGIHQRETPYMDGVPFLTQCPITQGSTFRYEFDVPLAGTYFWHSHAGVQRADGVFGPLIVRRDPEIDVHSNLYDYDLPEHELLIWDLFSDLALSSNLRGHIRDQRELPQNLLINGKGIPRGFFDDFRYFETLQGKGKPFVPLHELRIESGRSYRIRVISNGVTLCPFELSIENHQNLEVIASDGFDLRPTIVESIVFHAGERWDFILRGNQPIGSYWIKVRGLLDCETQGLFQLAVLNYEGIREGTLPDRTIKRWEDAGQSLVNPGFQLNPVNLSPGMVLSGDDRLRRKYLTAAEISSSFDDDPQIIEQDEADHQFYLSFDFKPISNVNFGTSEDKSTRIVSLGQKDRRQSVVHYLPQFNYITHVMPESPPLSQPETINQMNVCDEESQAAAGINCVKKHCRCVHLLKARLGSIVELVLVDRGFRFDAAHPFHLHGSNFRVVALERLGNNTDAETIKQMDLQGLISRRRVNAPIKDTVYVPDGGYTILRFRADNPGFWFFHCHVEFHQERGMSLILQVGEPSDMRRAPRNFPRCQSYLPPVKGDMETL